MGRRRKNPAAVALRRLGTSKGAAKAGRARWEGIEAAERSAEMRAVRLKGLKKAKKKRT